MILLKCFSHIPFASHEISWHVFAHIFTMKLNCFIVFPRNRSANNIFPCTHINETLYSGENHISIIGNQS